MSSLTKEATIEIQEAAKFNYMKRLREEEEKEELANRVKKAIAESKINKPKAAASKTPVVESKGN